jgi:hypothetical protein
VFLGIFSIGLPVLAPFLVTFWWFLPFKGDQAAFATGARQWKC